MIRKTFEVNTISHLWTIREFMPDMIANKKGHIVNIASMAGMAGTPSLSDYSGSKFGAIGINDSLRTELLIKGLSSQIKTTCICPFFINTGMFEGVKRNALMQILDQHQTVDRIVNAIRQEEEFVVLPYVGNIVFLGKLLPI